MDLDANVHDPLHELPMKTCQPFPVRRMEIGMPGDGVQHLGTPAVCDRVVQYALSTILTSTVGPHFHYFSFGSVVRVGEFMAQSLQ